MKKLAGRGPLSRDWFGLDGFRPGPRFIREGSRLFLLDEVGSTNEFLLGRGQAALGRVCVLDEWGWSAQNHEMLEPLADVEPGLVVVAQTQTAGLGRQGRSWLDCGGLNLSVVVPAHRASFDQGFSVWLGLMVVLCLREGFNVDARLKWPNDIMCGNRKLGGILLENSHSKQGTAIIAGLGLNLTTRATEFPAGLQGLATSVLIETGRRLRPADFAGLILSAVEDEIDRFNDSGWKPWRHALSCLDCLLGKEVRLARGRREFHGRAIGIDDSGSLLLEDLDGQVRSFSAGEIHLLAHSEGPSNGGSS